MKIITIDETSRSKEDHMTERTDQILSQALGLPPSERAKLAERLFSSLDISQEKRDRLWAQEADSRIDAYERGEIKAIPANKVFKSIYS
jgi:putative addiction module component (TIGR02574 family)